MLRCAGMRAKLHRHGMAMGEKVQRGKTFYRVQTQIDITHTQDMTNPYVMRMIVVVCGGGGRRRFFTGRVDLAAETS